MKEKTFCDPIYPCSEETGQRFLRFYEQLAKERNMEEKKTKKMTRAEAFEYLKGKKVYVAGKSGEIQEVLFKAGFSWDKSSASQKIESTDAPFLYMGNEGILMYGTSMEFFIRDTNEEISADDILSIEIVDEKYELEFNYDKVVELAKPLMHYLNEVGCRDSIRVSQYGIVHEPMSTLIFDNGIGE